MSKFHEISSNKLQQEYSRKGSTISHEEYFWELFRRAICQADTICWDLLVKQYKNLLFKWVLKYSHGETIVGDSTVEDLVQDTMASFWRSFTCERLSAAKYGLPSVLSYWESCAWSSVRHASRKTQLKAESLDESLQTSKNELETQLFVQEAIQELLIIVDECCNNDLERRIAKLTFVEGWKPQEILEVAPELLTDIKEIYKIVRNLKDRLSRHPRFKK